MPCFVISPALKNWLFAPNPVLGATPRERIASFEPVVVVREVDAEAIVEHARLEAELESFARAPASGSGLPNVLGVRTPWPFGPATGRERLQRGVERGLLARAAVRARGAGGC